MPYIYNRKWRDVDEKNAPKNIKPVIRFKSKIDGNTILKDLVNNMQNKFNVSEEDALEAISKMLRYMEK